MNNKQETNDLKSQIRITDNEEWSNNEATFDIEYKKSYHNLEKIGTVCKHRDLLRTMLSVYPG